MTIFSFTGLRRIAVTVATVSALALLAGPPSAGATISSVFTAAETSPPGGIPCVVQPTGIRLCNASPRSTVKSFDDVPIDVNMMFPPEPAIGQDGDYPVVGIFPGWGGGKTGFNSISQRWLDLGYAVFSMTPRGWLQSCGTQASRTADPTGCAAGYIRVMDDRYEVRDAQYLLGFLVDEKLIDPRKIAATGDSYGAGMSVALAVLKDRVMLRDGTLADWKSPAGTSMQLAAAASQSGWSDLAQSLVPNGSTLDYVAEAPYFGPQHRIGVQKQANWSALMAPLFNPLQDIGFVAPAGTEDADLITWNDVFSAGGPYDNNTTAQDLIDEFTTHHSAHYIPDTVAPAPLLLSNGWNDDLFPVDEAVRLYNKVRADYPQAPINLLGLDRGHPRSGGRTQSNDLLRSRQNRWFDYYVKGVGDRPGPAGLDPVGGVEVLTTTCRPPTAPNPPWPPQAGPFDAANWAQLAPGEIRLHGPAKKTIEATGTEFGDVFSITGAGGPGPCPISPTSEDDDLAATDNPATANYRLDPAPDPGFTIAGSPTVIANFTVTGPNDQVAARLLDVYPATDTQALIARGLWRPEVRSEPLRQVFQLHPQAYEVKPGHVLKLELLPNDAPYGRANPASPDQAAQHPVVVKNLVLRLPVLEQPCDLGGLVRDPASKFVPDGYQLAIDVPPANEDTQC